ncbi:PREDICTED: IRK-interacting protein-like isoform X2 [Camelina sativa]|uniref:IRK-interacting protein-like isoform X2 n=1 Tax=Camelina sativa TaxID=90675 RepID=A0ABM0XBJ3_CAMSA|nr:PREDICTED: IRK-interacting protein-like isoform X2 [Camelina sativa]
MLPGILLCSLNPRNHSKKKKNDRESLDTEPKDIEYWYSVQFNRDPPRFALKSDNTTHHSRRNGGEFSKAKKRGEMANKVSNFSDLIQRVTASCLLHPLSAGRQDLSGNRREEYDSEEEIQYEDALEKEDVKDETIRVKSKSGVSLETVQEMEMVMDEVFTAAAALKRAYVALQEAHSPWDPEKMHDADMAMVAELRRIGLLRERFRRMRGTGSGGGGRRKNDSGRGLLRDAVAPYEAVVKELKKEVKVKDTEIENLKEKVKAATSMANGTGGGKKHRLLSSRKVNCSTQIAVSPVPELFEMTMIQVKEASKSFTGILLSLMRAAHWDIAAAVRSIEAASAASDGVSASSFASSVQSSVPNQHAKFALESYICRKIFQGFDHETFYMDGSLSSLINPDQYRRDCFAQFKDMKAMDPMELLGILPTCHFGKFCSKKYLSIIHHKMEESLFGDSEQRELVLAGNHPRSQFYGEFLGLAKAVWLLHLLAFSLDPSPSHFEANRGAEFHSQYMESVVRFSDGRVPAGQVVGFPVCPGFKLSHQGKGSIIKSRVYLVPRASTGFI